MIYRSFPTKEESTRELPIWWAAELLFGFGFCFLFLTAGAFACCFFAVRSHCLFYQSLIWVCTRQFCAGYLKGCSRFTGRNNLLVTIFYERLRAPPRLYFSRSLCRR
jgi:hypothetical protein